MREIQRYFHSIYAVLLDISRLMYLGHYSTSFLIEEYKLIKQFLISKAATVITKQWKDNPQFFTACLL